MALNTFESSPSSSEKGAIYFKEDIHLGVQIEDRQHKFQAALEHLSELHNDTQGNDIRVKELNDAIITFLTRTEGKSPGGVQPLQSRDDTSSVERLERLLKLKFKRPQTNTLYASSMVDALMYILSRTLYSPNHIRNTGVDPKIDLSLLYGNSPIDHQQLIPRGVNRGDFEEVDFMEFKARLINHFETRGEKAPDAATAILFCLMINHNRIANGLREHSSDKKDDEDWVFSTAQTINCLQFQNIIIEDVLHGLTGLPLVGPLSKLDIDTSNNDPGKAPRDDESRLLYQIFAFDVVSDGNTTGTRTSTPAPPSPNEILHILRQAIQDPTKAYGLGDSSYNHILAWYKEHPTVTFNDYRKFLGLNPLSSWNDWTDIPEVEDMARKLYKNLDSLELFPGLFFEKSFDGFGFNLGYTHTYALFVDIVKTLRRDPIRKDMTEGQLTKWGLEQVKPFQTQEPFKFGGQLSKLLLRNLPSLAPFNNAYVHFPLSLPNITEERLRERKIDDAYDMFFPSDVIPLELDSLDLIKFVFNHPQEFNTLYGKELKLLTKGYGFMLGFDDDPTDPHSHHDLDVYMTCYALMPDVRAFKEYSTYFQENVYKRLKIAVEASKSRHHTSVDLAKDVIIPVCTQWACEKIYGLELKEGELGGYFEGFLNIFSVVFNKVSPEQLDAAREGAQKRSDELSRIIRKEIKGRNAEIHQEEEGWFQFFSRVFSEYYSGRRIASSKHTFLDQLIQANHSVVGRFPLVTTFDSMRHFFEPQEDEKEKWIPVKKGKERLEQARLASNTLAFAVVAAVNYAQACLHVLDYYLRNPPHLNDLLSDAGKDDSKIIMNYCHEALRLNQPLFLFRRATVDMTLPYTNPPVQVKAGDIVYANLWTVHKAMDKFDVKRPDVHSLYGVGFHRCPAANFVKETMPELLRPIFQLPSLRLDTQKVNQPDDKRLPCRALDPRKKAILFQRMYRNGSDAKPFPMTLPVTFNAENFKAPKPKKDAQFDTWKMKAVEGSTVGAILLFISYLLGLFNGVTQNISDNLVMQTSSGLTCSHPVNVIQKWAVNTFLPDADGFPAPVEYTFDHMKPHRLSLIDIDHRDLMMAVYVDNMLRGQTTDFALDKSMDCGEDLGSCLRLNYSGGVVVVPPGKHTVKISWVGKEYMPGTNEMDWGHDYSRRFKWQIEGCS